MLLGRFQPIHRQEAVRSFSTYQVSGLVQSMYRIDYDGSKNPPQWSGENTFS